MNLQRKLCDYVEKYNTPVAVNLKGGGFDIPAVVVIPSSGYPIVTVRKPQCLKTYQVRGNDFLPRGNITRPAAYKEFDDLVSLPGTTISCGPQMSILGSVDIKDCKRFIVEFLRINPEPSDKQVHELADAIGIDKETLEAVIYKMLGKVVASTEDELILEDKKDPRRSSIRVAPLNDLGFDKFEIDEVQDDTYSDGVVRYEFQQD